MIYESERAGFMADHKSVSAQLTLGNFPTPFSNQTPLPGHRFPGRPTTGAGAALVVGSGLTVGSQSAQVGGSRREGAEGRRAREMEKERSKYSKDWDGR